MDLQIAAALSRLSLVSRHVAPANSSTLRPNNVLGTQYFDKFLVYAGPGQEERAQEMQKIDPNRFQYVPSKFEKFPDGTDNIELGGYTPVNRVAGQHVLFLASFHNNDVILSQLHAMSVLLESFIRSFTVLVAYYPFGTMERVEVEGTIATANTMAKIFSNLPSCGRPLRLMMYDLHTLQNRFYLGQNALATLHSTVPIMTKVLKETDEGRSISCVAFPDDGANKRYHDDFTDMPRVICRKERKGNERIIGIIEGDPVGQHVLIVDDLVQSGGTLFECGKALRELGATKVSCFVAHAVFPKESWKRFARGGDRDVFDTIWVTNTIPTSTKNMPTDNVFRILDITSQIIEDL